MRTPVKGIALMGNRYEYGGLCLDSSHQLYITANGCNKLVCYDVLSDSILWSANALGYAPYCEVQSQCFLDTTAYNPSVVYLLKNGEVWRKDLTDFTEEKWGDPLAAIPDCRGASGIEYHDGALYVTFPQFNLIRKMALGTLGIVAEGNTGVPTASPYPPAAIAWDGVNSRFVCIDPVKGDLVYMDETFNELGRERYTYQIYGRAFDGDLTWSQIPLPANPGQDYLIACVDKLCIQYGEPWWELWEVNDITGTKVQIDAVILDNVEVGENVVKHLELVNSTSLLRQAVTVSVTDDPTIEADDYTWVSDSSMGPWLKTQALGDIAGTAKKDFYVRFNPAFGINLGSFSVELIVDYTKV